MYVNMRFLNTLAVAGPNLLRFWKQYWLYQAICYSSIVLNSSVGS